MSHSSVFTNKPLPKSLVRLGITIFLVGLVIGLVGLFADSHKAVFSYLVAFVFFLSIAIGALLLIAIEYVTGADWSVPIRRIVEFIAGATPYLILLAIPLLLNMGTLFHWSHSEAVEADKILTGKEPYLNVTFFIIRVVFCFGIWSLFYFIFSNNSQRQDATKDQLLTKKNRKYSAIFIPVFALTATMASIDWLMSLEPHWFSTIFGVYFFSGSLLAGLAVTTIATIILREKGYLHPKMNNDHYYSLGALMFGFINFWAYIAFSQYLLIWYANLPEETFWFLDRWQNVWAIVSLILIIAHFVVPYALLLSQPAKMDPKRLKFASIWILVAHFVDLYWIAMPQYHAEDVNLLGYLADIGFPIAMIGLYILIFYYTGRNKNIIPVGDPKLERGLNFRL